MVVAARAAAQRRVAFDHRRAAELATPDDQRVVEQAALLQILDQAPPTPDRSAPQLFFKLPTTSEWASQPS